MSTAQVISFTPSSYYAKLEGSIKDKLWFVERVPAEVTVFADFGCGDGALLNALRQVRPGAELIGYDHNGDAVEAAIARHMGGGFWTPHLAFFAASIATHRKQGKKVCLILSSVVHEVLSQGTSWKAFWQTIRDLGADYVAIRDMAVEGSALETEVDPALELTLMRCDQLTHFLLYGVKDCGRFANRAEMLEGLLKYRYQDTEREYAENYFALTVEQWHNLTACGSGYQLRHFDHHSMAWHRARWHEDFGVDIPDATHLTVLLKKA